MKKIYLLLATCLLALVSMGGCKSHKETVKINVEPKLEEGVVWHLMTVRNKQMVYEPHQQPATIQFNPESGVISGNAGCNKFFANYKDHGDGKIEFSEITSSKMACPEPFMKIERTYLPVLSKVDGYRVGEYTLELLQGDKVILTYEKEQEVEVEEEEAVEQ
ncbi:MAG: META domain-containing protein [Bacteroidales bacterium]|nr:META domain-containing protein [Bacteroidales bacterium]